MPSLLWKPLLAATLPPSYDLSTLPYPLYTSPKIDGVRCMVQNCKVVSRKGIQLRNRAVQDLFGKQEYEGLDGELVIGKPYGADTFTRTMDKGRGVNNGSAAAAAWAGERVTLWVIDRRVEGTFEERLTALREDGALVGGSGAYIKLIPQVLIRNPKQLAAYEAKCLKRGYEGVMLRRADSGLYQQKPGKDNRSTLKEFDLVKLKRMEQGVGVIQRCYALKHNRNDEKTAAGKRSSKKAGIEFDVHQVGSVDLLDGPYEFSVNVQTDALRRKGPQWWRKQVGKRVRYTYQPTGCKDAPRFPQCTFLELLG